MHPSPVRQRRLQLAANVADLYVISNILYVRIDGVITDDVVQVLMPTLTEEIDRIGRSHVRVLHSISPAADAFQLSNEAVQIASSWSARIEAIYPGSISYNIASSAEGYGTARMYGLMSEIKGSQSIPLQHLDELPPEIHSLLLPLQHGDSHNHQE